MNILIQAAILYSIVTYFDMQWDNIIERQMHAYRRNNRGGAIMENVIAGVITDRPALHSGEVTIQKV